MKLSSNVSSPMFWRYVDELDKRDLDLSYPEKLVKAIKTAFFENRDWTNKSLTLKINQRNGLGVDTSYYDLLMPNTRKALMELYNYKCHKNIIGHKLCPTTQEIVDALSESDKYFAMCVALKNEMPNICHQIDIKEYKYAATSIALLTERFNEEIKDLINQYFIKKSHYDPKRKVHITYNAMVFRKYIISNEAYVTVRIVELESKSKLTSLEDIKTKVNLIHTVYSNCDILCVPDKNYHITNTGSFLLDCKKITQLKKNLNFSKDEIIDFHDLIRYGNYSDFIMSPIITTAIGDIIKTDNWIQTFFFTLSLYCNQLIDIETDTSQVYSTTKDVADPSKLEGIGMFMEAIQFLDGMYEHLVLKNK